MTFAVQTWWTLTWIAPRLRRVNRSKFSRRCWRNTNNSSLRVGSACTASNTRPGNHFFIKFIFEKTFAFLFVYSVGEFEIYMTESSAFLFYGMENFFTYIPSSKIASLTFEGKHSPFSVIIVSVLQIPFSTSVLTDCQMVMLFDRMQTNSSYARQSKMDVLKT